MNPATRRTETIPTKSPLSAFLSDLIQERFGSVRTNGKIVVDNALSHAPLRSMCKNSEILDSDSITRTSSSSSSSRWDPNVLPASTERNSISSDKGHRKDHALESTLLGSSYDIPTVPVRRDSPGKWRTKQALFGTAKKDKLTTRLIQGSDATFEPLGESSILPPPYPIRQVSLQPSTIILSKTESNLGQELEESKARPPFGTKDSSKQSDPFPPQYPIRQDSLSSPDFISSRSEAIPSAKSNKKSKENSDEKGKMNRETKKKKKSKRHSSKSKKTKKSRKKAEEKTGKKASVPRSRRSERLSSKLSEPKSPGTPTKRRAYLRKSLSPKKKPTKERSKHELAINTTPSPIPALPTKSSLPVLPKVQKRTSNEREIVLSTGILDSFQCPIIEEEKISEYLSDNGSQKIEAARRYHRTTVVPRRSRRPVSKPMLNMDQMNSTQSNLVPPEGRSLVSAMTSLPSSAANTKSPSHSPSVKFHLEQKKSMVLANHRSLSETLLSCDRDRIEPDSTTLPQNQNRKRSPPVRPIRQLSRALFEL